MLAYTAVDGLRAISRDFDLDWQPESGEFLSAPRRDWRRSFQGGQRLDRYSLGALVALLPFGAAWLR
jgi:hypothetical protein